MPSGNTPTIGIDCRFASTHSGIGRYTRELVRHLLKRNDPWRYVLFVRDPRNHGLGELPARDNWQLVAAARRAAVGLAISNWPPYSFQEQCFFPALIKRMQIDLLHVPHFNVPLCCDVPFIATIHDLILHQFPNEASLPKRLAYRILMHHTVKRAAHLIAVSNATKSNLIAQYPHVFSSSEPCLRHGELVEPREAPLDLSQSSSLEENTKRISVVHEGISSNFCPRTAEEQQRVLAKYQLPASFLLYVGATKEHKNVQTLIDVCPLEHTLVLVTSGKEIGNLRLLPNVRILQNVPDADLPALYSAARCLVSPSLSEGFNFPVLEALACGCPVLATKVGSTPEVAGGHATLVEPTVEGLGGALRHLPSPPSAAAMNYARSFSWEKVAEETAKLYADVLRYAPACHPE